MNNKWNKYEYNDHMYRYNLLFGKTPTYFFFCYFSNRDTETITLHESFLPKKLDNKKCNQVVEQPKLLLPSMESQTNKKKTWISTKQRSKGIVSAIIDAAKCPEKESLGWVGIEEQHENDIHDTSTITLPTTPPPPPIENDTHIFDLLRKDNAYFIHHSKKNETSASINSATVEKLVEIITKDIDTDLLMDFFLTFRQFLTPIKLCKLLILRFRWALLDNSDDRRLIRIRTFVVIRYWLTHYWEHDFMVSRTLRFMLCTFLSQLRSHPTILNSPRDENIIRNLRNVLKRQRKLYSVHLDNSARVYNTDARQSYLSKNSSNHHQYHHYQSHSILSDENLQWQSITSSNHHEQEYNKNTNTNKSQIPSALLNHQKHHYRRGTSKSDGNIDNQQFRQWKELRSSTSSTSLPFIGRSRRHSTCSQRSVYSENAWSAKMNYNIKKIKRSVPTVYQSILQGMSTTNPHQHYPIDCFSDQQQQQNNLSLSEKCSCEKKLNNNSNNNYNNNNSNSNQRYRSLPNRSTPSLMKSASKFFDFKRTLSSSTKTNKPLTVIANNHLHHQHQSNCPYYTNEFLHNNNTYSSSPSVAIVCTASLSSSSYKKKNKSKNLLRSSIYSDAPSTIATTTTTSSDDISVPMSPPPLHPLLFSHSNRKDYKSFILHFRSEIIAQQFCIMEQKMLQLVTWNELAELRWRKKSKGKVISPDLDNDMIRDGVEHLIGFFNKTCQWVASEIVRTRNMDIRVRVIEKFIRIALKCYHHRNYSTLMQMLLGLQSPAVSRLEKTWQRVDHYEMQIFGELKELAKPFRNWKNIRDEMTKAIEDISESSAVDSILIKKKQIHNSSTDAISSPIPFLSCSPGSISGCIPFLGLYLSDLVFNAELPTYIDTSKLENREPFGDTYEEKELCKRLGTHLVNYNKFRITASIIKHILAFQVLCRTYSFDYHEEVSTHLKNIQLLDNTEIRKQSGLCESDSI
ncbi:unnamed protein product [Cunninghamella blakesleeana]